MTLTVEIEEAVQKSLEEMATENGKQVGQFVVDIIDEYVDRSSAEGRASRRFMRLSETSFKEWNNEDDAVYDNL